MTTYLAARLHTLGGALQIDNLPVDAPQPGHVRLKVAACGVNFADTLMSAGKYQVAPPLPFSPGMEVAGTIDALGPNVSGLTQGQRVAAYVGYGGFAEMLEVPAAACVALPDQMSDVQAAAFLIAYGTSHVALGTKAGLQPGETLLVTGAAGGVGQTAVEIGKLMGARVIASARGEDRLAQARAAGADHVVCSDTGDLRSFVKELGGADVVYDTIGGAVFEAALRATRPEARVLPIGFASGTIPQIPANIVLVKNLSILGLYWGGYANLRPSVLTDSFDRLFGWFAKGRLSPHVSHVVSLHEAETALELLRTRKSTGKVVVRMV